MSKPKIVNELLDQTDFTVSDLVLHCLPTSQKKDARLIWVDLILSLN